MSDTAKDALADLILTAATAVDRLPVGARG